MQNITGATVTIMVRDMDIAVDFYRVIGFDLKQRWGNYYALLDVPGLTIGLHPYEKKELTASAISIGLLVDDIAQSEELLKQNKIACRKVDDENSGLYLHFNDHDGTQLNFFKPKF